MQEVSCRVVSLLVSSLEARRVDPRELVAGLDVELETLRRTSNRISWDAFTALLARFEEIGGGPEALERVGHDHQRSDVFRFVNRVSQLFLSARDIYWMGTVWFGPALFTITRGTFEELPDGRIRETLEIPEDYVDSPAFFRAMLGSLRAAPQQLGQGDAHVEMELSPRRAVYWITPPPPITLWARGRRLFGSVMGARQMIKELSAQHEQLRESYEELRGANAKIAGQAHQLERVNRQIRDHNELLQAQVAERKRAEEARRRLEGQLVRAQKLESLGVLAAGIAHDFNNLLFGIQGNAEVALADLERDTRLRGPLVDIERASKRASDLTQQLLAYAGKGKVRMESVDLSALVEEMAQLVLGGIARGTHLDLEMMDEGPWIQVDATQVRQLVMNLITNATESIDGGGVVTARTGSSWLGREYLDACLLVDELPEGEYAFIEVRDTGCGMHRATLDKIFDPFFTTKPEGRGLGLAAVLGIVRAHRGTLRVETEPGAGTTFRIFFPAAVEPAAPPGAGAPESADWEGSSGTILVVDDERALQSVIARMLARRGLEALTASDGAEAIEILRAHKDDVAAVILDVTMPGMSGVETFRALRAIRAELPVLFSSGHAQPDLDELLPAEPDTARIEKPFNLATLTEKLRRLLEGRG